MNIAAGIATACIAGIMNGIFPLPMKANKTWAWENNWLPFSFLSLALLPAILTWYTMPNPSLTLRQMETTDIAFAMGCGVFIYTGSLLFGISIVYAGLTLSFALLVGAMNCIGILLPRLLLYHSLIHSSADWFVLGGIVLSLFSVTLGFLAGKWKSNSKEDIVQPSSKRVLGSALAVLGGVLSGFLPVAMAMPWERRIVACVVQQSGMPLANASNVALSLVLLGGAIPNCCYCIFLLWKNRTYKKYSAPNGLLYWLLVFVMSALYVASVELWGVAISPSMLGALGSSVGWALFVGMIVISSTTAGLLQGEWKQSVANARITLAASLTCLLGSMVLICIGNYAT